MKRILFAPALVIFTIGLAQAQTTRTVKIKDTTAQKTIPMIKGGQGIIKQPVPTATTPAPAPSQPKTSPSTQPPPPVNTSTQNTSVYSLTYAKLSIGTGNDNKEFPSEMGVSVWIKDTKFDYPNECLYYVSALKNEMKVNSTTEFGLDKYPGNPAKFSLDALQKTGIQFTVSYLPNFFLDAWRVEGLTLTLEFKDQNGKPHPTFGSKTISFPAASGLLNGEYSRFFCTIDGNFNPLLAKIEKR